MSTTVSTTAAPSLGLVALPQVISQLADNTPIENLPLLLEALKDGLATVQTRMKEGGADPAVERLVRIAMISIQLKSFNFGDGVSEAVVRRIATGVTIEEAQTGFDESASDVDSNQVGASFNVDFRVGGAERMGYVSGEATNCMDGDGETYEGRIESNYFDLEDDLDGEVDGFWKAHAEHAESLRKDVEVWRAAVGLSAADITWQDFARAVSAIVGILVSESKYNKDDWVWDFVRIVITQRLGALGNGTLERPTKSARLH